MSIKCVSESVKDKFGIGRHNSVWQAVNSISHEVVNDDTWDHIDSTIWIGVYLTVIESVDDPISSGIKFLNK